MPTPVAAARQCLTQESTAVLDEAVAVARRRGHAQTTSLHMVSSLLSLPSSSLQEACTRTRNSAYSTRVQFKALELSLSVSLDRLPSSQASRVEEPPVSNSLMAAIKRSQANQRRQPENFTFYQQQQQQQQYTSCSSVPVVKVELQNLILSILDDPLVSRVFGEAGFRSCDIKMATIRPCNTFYPSHLFGCTPRYKRPNPPLFLCNLSGNDSPSEVGGKGFSFPFMGCYSGDENSRRISEVLLRGKRRSPLLMGISAGDALRNFLETVERKIKGVLPQGLSGLSVVCIKDEIMRYLSGDCDEGPLKLRFEEVERMVVDAAEAGILVNFGDLNAFVADDVSVDGLRFLVSKLAGLIEVSGGKLRLIGAASTYEVYFKILNKFPTLEDDWGLEVLPITSIKFSVGGSYPRSSLMESFVPLGGFFSVPPETVTPSSNACIRCHLCNEKYEQEVAALPNGGGSLFQSAEPGSQNGSSSIKGKDDRLLLNAKMMALQKKWDSICEQHHHLNRTFAKGYNHLVSGYHYPRVLGFQVDERKREKTSNRFSNEQGNKNASSIDLEKSSSTKELSSTDMPSKPNSLSIISNSVEELKGDTCGLKPAQHFDSLSDDNSRTSPTSVTSVTTDLGLGIVSASTSREPVDQSHLNTFTRCISKCTSQSSLSIYNENQMPPDVKDLKLLFKALVERADHQQTEAISSIIEALSLCQTRLKNTWMILRGGDRLSKKKVGLALAETLYGSPENFIYMDLSFQDDNTHIDTLFNSQVMNKYDITMRGTVVDFLVEKLSKKPRVVFFENIDKADLVVQNTLSEAAKNGRFKDMFGREVSVKNCIFLGATKSSESCQSEEDVVTTRGSLIQLLIRFDLNDGPTRECDVSTMNKRNRDKIIDQEVNKRAYKKSNSYLDLNLPAEGSEICNTESDTDSNSENSRSWFEDFERLVDQTVVFKKFDFETYGEKIVKNVSDCLHEVVGSECSIEIEPKVMQQLVAGAYLFGMKKVKDWVENVVRKGFLEAMGKFSINVRSIIKLVTCEEQDEGLLPARITIK